MHTTTTLPMRYRWEIAPLAILVAMRWADPALYHLPTLADLTPQLIRWAALGLLAAGLYATLRHQRPLLIILWAFALLVATIRLLDWYWIALGLLWFDEPFFRYLALTVASLATAIGLVAWVSHVDRATAVMSAVIYLILTSASATIVVWFFPSLDLLPPGYAEAYAAAMALYAAVFIALGIAIAHFEESRSAARQWIMVGFLTMGLAIVAFKGLATGTSPVWNVALDLLPRRGALILDYLATSVILLGSAWLAAALTKQRAEDEASR